MRKLINIDFRSMAGLGPKAWDRDESRVSMHTAHPNHEKKHHPTPGPASESRKEDIKKHRPRR